MNKEFTEFLNGGYKGIAQVRDNFPSDYNEIIDFNRKFGDIHWGHKLYNYVNNLIILPTCKCGNPLKFYKFNKGYAAYCSSKCRYSDNELNEKRKKSCLIKYGVENPLQSSEIQEKRRKIFFEKHGVNHQSQLAEVREKRRETNLERFGTTTNLLCEDTKNKIRETNLKKFGVEHNSQSPDIKEKKKKTNLKRCGFEYNLQSNEFKEKSKNTTLDKYGVEHTSLSSVIRKKQTVTKRKNKIKAIAAHLNIDVNDISFSGDILTIKNYCHKHDSFDISINLFHQRRFKYDNKICTKCYSVERHVSNSEAEIKYYIDSLNVSCNNNNKKILINRYEIDIYMPDYKLGIEYNGIYWHSNLYKDSNYHLDKTTECEQIDIQLLHIFEDEWIYKKEIVKSIIKIKLNIIENKINVNECQIKEINDDSLIELFLENNHIQGKINVDEKIKIDLFHKNELVSVMVFSKKRINNEYEILRFCNKLNTEIIGGASKLLNYFIEAYHPKSIVTFVDRRYSQGRSYKELGFKFIGNTKPNYWYFKKDELIRYHSSEFTIDRLIKEGCDPTKTEHQIMEERGFLSIHDCGYMELELKID